jgi:hypothetical protein
MPLINVSCGTIELNNILTIQPVNYAATGWIVEIHYEGEKTSTKLKCKDETSAKACYEEIKNKIDEYNQPLPPITSSSRRIT